MSRNFRSGSNPDPNFKAVLDALNEARGTAYNVEPGSAVYAENFAIARAIASIWDANERLANQFDTNKMGAFIPRWEKILGITAIPGVSLSERKKAIAAQFSLWSREGTTQNMIDLVKECLKEIFIEITHLDSNSNKAAMPGGLINFGGANIPDGEWFSKVSHACVRLWQPRNKLGVPLITDAEYASRKNKYKPIYDNHAPAHVSHSTYRFVYEVPGFCDGTIGGYELNNAFGGFITSGRSVNAGEKMEVVHNNGIRRDYVVSSVSSANLLYLSEPLRYEIDGAKVRLMGFVLNTPGMLDNAGLR